MAGLSQRFTRAGYKLPKYMLPAHGRSVFAHAVGSFAAQAATEPFLFIVRDVAGTPDFVRAEAAALGIARVEIVVLDSPTRGQAETVELGLANAAVAVGEPLTIFNIDTFRPGFHFPEAFPRTIDGYLEVFVGEGDNWSYVRPIAGGACRVAETAEKRPISDLCCTGLYHFGSVQLFRDAYHQTEASFSAETGPGELYVAPMYNLLIQAGRDVRYQIVPKDEVIFCGIPAEYEALLAAPAFPSNEIPSA
jgi:hypothetical protein